LAVNFIGGGKWSTWRKPPTFRKTLTNFTPFSSTNKIDCQDITEKLLKVALKTYNPQID
jgi:hypothetical protein